MIRNERQLSVSKDRLSSAEEALKAATDQDRVAWRHLVADLKCEIDEYEKVRDGVVRSFEINSLDDLCDALIKARLARKLTQKDLADELGVREQMVQRDEAGSYENAGLARLADIADALGYELVGRFRPKEGDVPAVQITNGTVAGLTSSMISSNLTQVHTPSIFQLPAAPKGIS